MSKFGQTLFGGSPFIRWALTPFVLIFAISLPLLMEDWTPTKVALFIGVELVCLTLLAGFWLPPRLGHWAFRGLAGLVFFAYAAYLVHEFAFTDTPFKASSWRGEASPYNALLGFIVIGLPSLWFALRGRFTLRAEPSEEELAVERQAFEEHLLRPDWEFYARHLQRPVPQALRELYADRALVTAGGFDYRSGLTIGTFGLIEEAAMMDAVEPAGGEVIAIAASDCGDPIYLRPGPAETDAVYITYHDGGETEVLAESVDALLRKLREVTRDG